MASKKKAPEKKGNCYKCNKEVGEDHFCSGCREFICDECDELSPMGFGHDPEDHYESDDGEEIDW